MQILTILENIKIKDLGRQRVGFSIINRFFTPHRYHADNDKKRVFGLRGYAKRFRQTGPTLSARHHEYDGAAY
jgi:hypothetical protein